MTKIETTLVLFITLFGFTAASGQELVKKKKSNAGITEEFFVLKEDKDIKHGPSLTTVEDILEKKYIVEYGHYDRNQKSGVWLSFYYGDPSNSLKAIGPYANDQKQGDWKYYYTGTTSKNVQTIFGSEKRTNILPTKKDSKGFQIEYDTTEQQVLCAGRYEGDKKVGVWTYFSRSGYLLHRYDHDAHEFLANNLREPDNDFLVYLGGSERFYNYYYIGNSEMRYKTPVTMTSEVIFEVGRDGSYKLVSASGDAQYKRHTEQILKAIPNDWILLNSESQKKLQVVATMVVGENSFHKYKFSLDLKVVD